MKIKVLHLINSMEAGGAESLLKSLLNNVDTENFEWHLAYFYKTGSFLENWKTDIRIQNFSKNGRFSFLQLIKLYAYMKRNKFSILHTHLVHAGIIGKLFGKFLHIPVIVSTRHHEVLPKSNTFLYRAEDYLAKKWNTCTISISGSVHTFMLKMGYAADKIRLIPNGVDTAFFKPDSAVTKKSHSIISAGRLVAEKNYSLLIDAVHILTNKYKDLYCTIIGDGPLFRKLSEKIASLSLQKNIILSGAKSNEAVKEMMQQVQVYISTSVFEGLPISVLEAMALELPVIASASGSIRDIIMNDQTGLLIESNDAEQLAVAVESLFEHPEKRIQLGKAARKAIVENYSIKLLTAKTQALYRELLEQEKRA